MFDQFSETGPSRMVRNREMRSASLARSSMNPVHPPDVRKYCSGSWPNILSSSGSTRYGTPASRSSSADILLASRPLVLFVIAQTFPMLGLIWISAVRFASPNPDLGALYPVQRPPNSPTEAAAQHTVRPRLGAPIPSLWKPIGIDASGCQPSTSGTPGEQRLPTRGLILPTT